MRISKSLSLTFAVLLCAIMSVRGDDNAAQSAARAALMQKMQELDSQSNNSAAPAPGNQAPAATPQPAESTPPTATPPAPETAPATPESTPAPQNAAPAEPSATSAPEMAPSAAPTPVPADVAPQTQAVTPAETAPAATPAMTAPASQNSAEAEEQAIVARHSVQTMPPATNALPVMNEMAPPPPQPAQMPVPQKKRGFFSHILHPFGSNARPATVRQQPMQPMAQNYAAKNNAGFAPITPPPAPVSSDQEAQLQALLEKYKADQITPDEYQAQRAAIIGPR